MPTTEERKEAYFSMRLPTRELEILKQYCQKKVGPDVIREFELREEIIMGGAKLGRSSPPC